MEGVVEKKDICARLRQALVWSSMPEKDLQAECTQRGLQPKAGLPAGSRAERVASLLQSMFGPRPQAEAAKEQRAATPQEKAKPPAATKREAPPTTSKRDVPGTAVGAKWPPASRTGARSPPRRSKSSAPTLQHRAKSPPKTPMGGRAPPQATPWGAAWSAQPAAAKPKPRPKSVRPKATPRPKEPDPRPTDSEDEGHFGTVDASKAGPRVRRALRKWPSYSGELPPDLQEAEELWTDQDLHNFFFSSGFIKPKKKNVKPKITQAMIDLHYKTLGLKSGAKLPAVRQEYRKLALLYHPDKNHHSEDTTSRFQEITEAYAVICQHLEAKPP